MNAVKSQVKVTEREGEPDCSVGMGTLKVGSEFVPLCGDKNGGCSEGGKSYGTRKKSWSCNT